MICEFMCLSTVPKPLSLSCCRWCLRCSTFPLSYDVGLEGQIHEPRRHVHCARLHGVRWFPWLLIVEGTLSVFVILGVRVDHCAKGVKMLEGLHIVGAHQT